MIDDKTKEIVEQTVKLTNFAYFLNFGEKCLPKNFWNNYEFWKNLYDKNFSNELPNNIYPTLNVFNSYFQFFIKTIPDYIHFELNIRNKSRINCGIHFENKSFVDKYIYLLNDIYNKNLKNSIYKYKFCVNSRGHLSISSDIEISQTAASIQYISDNLNNFIFSISRSKKNNNG